jgi:hypothetical protein
VRVLLDENLPHDLVDALVGHSVSTVRGLDLVPIVPEILAALDRVRPGTIELVGQVRSRRGD